MDISVFVTTMLLVGIGIAGLFWLGAWSSRTSSGEVSKQLRYQPTALAFALMLVGLHRLSDGSGVRVNLGSDLQRPTEYLMVFGVADGTPWAEVVATVILLPLIVTTIVVYLQTLRGRRVDWKYLPTALALSAVFSVFNSLTEELIFRVIGIEALTHQVSATAVAVICGAWFGVPHYFGKPGGIPGVLMAGFLGWMMAVSVQQTGGLAVAWGIHFAQDVPIIAFILLQTRAASQPNSANAG